MRKARRLIIQKAGYVLPPTGDQACMDFFALYALLWEIGSGKSNYGRANSRKVPTTQQHVIDAAFEACTFYLADAMCRQLDQVVWEEANNACDETLIPPKVLEQWIKDFGPTQMMRDLYLRKLKREDGTFAEPECGEFWQTVGFHGATMLFEATFWKKYADAFGGERWAIITEAFRQLFDAVKHDKPLKDVALFLERMYGLRHNTDLLTDKKLMTQFKVCKGVADARARTRSASDFIPYVSPHVKRLITSSQRYLKDAPLWDVQPWQQARSLAET